MFAVRFLERAEKVTKTDVVVKVRHWLPLVGELHRGEDVVVRKHATVAELAASVWELKRFDSVAGAEDGVSGAMLMARSHISSANHMDLRKRALAAAKGSSGRIFSGWKCPAAMGPVKEAVERIIESGEAQGLCLRGGCAVKVRGETVVVAKTPLGLLRDGEVFFTTWASRKGLVQWRATNGEGGGASERRRIWVAAT